MTDIPKPEIDTPVADRKDWHAPQLRAVVPGKRTAGGPFNINDQDDPFYSLS